MVNDALFHPNHRADIIVSALALHPREYCGMPGFDAEHALGKITLVMDNRRRVAIVRGYRAASNDADQQTIEQCEATGLKIGDVPAGSHAFACYGVDILRQMTPRHGEKR